MTATSKARKRLDKKTVAILFLSACMLLLLYASPHVSIGIQRALSLCATTIIPALFPFIVLSELLSNLLGTNAHASGRLNVICRKICGVSSAGLLAFFIGCLCGFPLGVKCTTDLYRAGKITDREAEQLLAFVNNTGPAFLVSGIGFSLLHDRRIGLVLYGVQIVSACLTAWLIQRILPVKKGNFCIAPTHQHENGSGLMAAILHATASIGKVCGMVVFFSIPISLLSAFLRRLDLLCIISSFLEVGSAASLAASWHLQAPLAAMLTLTNAVCFGGLSVHMQAALFVSGLPIRMHRHTLGKLMQSAIACLLMLFIYRFA